MSDAVEFNTTKATLNSSGIGNFTFPRYTKSFDIKSRSETGFKISSNENEDFSNGDFFSIPSTKFSYACPSDVCFAELTLYFSGGSNDILEIIYTKR